MINKPDELVIDKICRSCMCQSENMRDVFKPKEQEESQTLQIAEIFINCTSIAISPGDGLPNLLCDKCENKLTSAYEFKIQCQKSDSALRQLTNQPMSNNIKFETHDTIVVQPDFNIADYSSDESNKGTRKRLKKFDCRFCKKELRTKKGLKTHIKKHTGEKLPTCYLCNAKFTRAQHLVRHMKTHGKLNTAIFCGECGKSFKSLDNLAAHKRNHKSETKLRKIKERSIKREVKPKVEAEVKIDVKNNDEESEEEDLLDQFFKQKVKQSGTRGKGIFECSYCCKIMTTYIGHKIHMRRHTGNDLAKCTYCDKTFTKSSHLKRHLRVHGVSGIELLKPKAPEKQIIPCEFCDRTFKYKKSFSQHMRTEHEMSGDESDVPLSDIIAKEKLKKESEPDQNNEIIKITQNELITDEKLKNTELEPTAITDFDHIPEQSMKIDEIELKIPKKANKIHVCHVCDTPFARSNHLTRHMTLHRALLIHKCERCEKAFATLEHLSKHIEEEHIMKPYECNICSKQFGRGEHLIRHLKVHQNTGNQDAKRLTCSICDKNFSRADHLSRHIKTHLINDKRHMCPECGRTFNRLDNLKTHQKTHSGIKETSKLHLCIYCGKEFNNSSNMIVHMRRHTGERPYKCAECGKGFPRSHDLKCHERTHSGEKPYHCALCGKSFNKSNKLLRHNRVHTGERPYVCNICGKAFTQSNDLALHMRRHTGARPYICGMCPARFIQSGQLKAHRRSTGHWVETPPDLKGGYRVEPVISADNPAIINFKTYGKDKPVDEALRIDEETKRARLLATTMGVMAEMQENNMMIESKMEVVDVQNRGFINLVAANGGGEIKFKQDANNTYIVTAPVVKTEMLMGHEVRVISPVTYETEETPAATVTYSIVTPVVNTTAFPGADFTNYQSFN